jgi:uncharacterized protein (DUF58 family)
MTPRLSRRVPGLLLATAVVYFFATNSEVVWLYGLAALLLALLPVGVLAPLVAVRRARILSHRLTRHGFLPPLPEDAGKVFSGDTVTVRLDCSGNTDACRFGAIRLRSGRVVPCGDGDGHDPMVVLSPSRRGRAEVEAVLVTSSWPLGILEVSAWLPLQLSFICHPRYMVPSHDTASGSTEPVGAASMRGVGEEFVGLREYQPGDSQRRVHWATTARAGKLMVVETALESRSPARYRVDLHSSAGPEATELAASVAASLAAGSVVAGRPFRLELPGRPRPSVRWRDALGNLAVMEPAAAAPAPEPAVLVSADAEGVTVEEAGGSWRLPADATLEDVAAALGGAGEEG